MSFWDNLRRYPQFFISSVLGLLVVLTTPIIKLYNNQSGKKVLFIVFFASVFTIFWILNLMLYSDT